MEFPAWVYIILLGALFLVMSRMVPKNDGAGASGRLVKEVEETISLFAAGVEEENEQLLQSVSQMKSDHERQVAQLNSRIERLEKMCYDQSQEVKQLLLARIETKTGSEAPQAAMQPLAQTPSSGRSEPAEEADPAATMNMKNRYPELFTLHAQGKSIEYIAKKLGMNKGEVNLIVQLARQEEANRA